MDKHGWQPRETAPKDGTEFLIWIPAFMEWDGKMAHVRYYSPWDCFIPAGASVEEGDDRFGIGVNVPSHWMPLPEPPSENLTA